MLGLALRVVDLPADWDRLCALGLPLTGSMHDGVAPGADELVQQVGLALLELERGEGGQDGERKREALGALILAIANHFPDVYRRHFEGSELVRGIVEGPVDGRAIKLQRIARDRLARYL